MNRALLLTVASILALCANGALATGSSLRLPSGKASLFKMPKGAAVLWNQNSDFASDAVTSMNLTSTGTAYDDQAADDFVVPRGKVWEITEVDVWGVYSEGPGPATSENIAFYKNAKGLPGKAVAKGTFNNLHGVDTGGDFAITLPRGGVHLKAGHYWVSAVANMFFVDNGEWGWLINGTQHGDQAVWRNPGGGLGECETWCTFGSLRLPGPDLLFELKGVSKNE